LRPHSLSDCADVTSCCLILHNMSVSDRVMGDPRARYKPDHSLETEERVQLPEDLLDSQGNTLPRVRVGLSKATDITQAIMTRRQEWLEVTNEYEHQRLYQALTRVKVKQYAAMNGQ